MALPLVGVEVGLFGMALFNANAKTVQAQLQSIGRSAYYLERESSRSLGGVGAGFGNVAQAANAAARSTAAAAQISIKATELQIKTQLTNQKASAAAAAARVQASLSVQSAALREQQAQLGVTQASQRMFQVQNGAIAQRLTAMNQLSAANYRLQQAQLGQQKAAQTQAMAISNASNVASQNVIRNAQAQAAVVTATMAAEAAAADRAAVSIARVGAAFMIAGGVIAAAIAAVAVAMGVSELAAAKYNQELAFIGAVSGSSKAQVDELSAAQLKLARNSTLSAGELATISEELVKAGTPIKDVAKEVLSAVNDLVVASRGELEAAKAANLAQVSMKGFGSSAREAADIATGAVQSSTLSFNDYADAIRQGGPVLSATGMKLSEFGALVSTVGQTIKSGTVVGTGLSVMFQRLQAPSAKAKDLMEKYGISLYDVNGKARPVVDVIKGLEDAFGPAAIASGQLTQQVRDNAVATIFGSRSAKILDAILDEGTDGYKKQLAAVSNLKAADVAGEVLAPSAAQAKELRNQIEVLGIAFGEGLDPLVQDTTTSMNNFLRSMDEEKVRSFSAVMMDNLYNAFSNIGSQLGESFRLFGEFWNWLVNLDKAIRTFFQNVTAAAYRFATNFKNAMASVAGDIANIALAASKGVGGVFELKDAIGKLGADLDKQGDLSYAMEYLTSDLQTAAFGFTEAVGRGWSELAAAEGKPIPIQDFAKAARDRVAAVQKAFDDAKAKNAVKKATGLERSDADETDPGFLPDDGSAAAKKIAEVIDRARELMRDFNKDADNATRDTTRSIANLYAKAFEEIDKAFEGAKKDVLKTLEDAQKSINQLDTQRSIEADAEARRTALDKQLAYEEQIRTRSRQLFEVNLAREREDQERAEEDRRHVIVRSLEIELENRKRARDEIRDGEDRTFEESQQKRKRDLEATEAGDEASLKKRLDGKEAELQAELDGEERTLKATQDARERSLQAQLDAQERFLKASQDQREAALKTQLDAEKRAYENGKALNEIQAEDARARAEAQTEYQDDIARGVKQSIAQTRLNAKFADITKSTKEKTANAGAHAAENEADATFEAGQQTKLEALRATFAQEDLALEASSQAAKLALDQKNEEESLALKTEAAKRKRDLDEQNERELSDLHAKFETDRQKLDDTLDTEARTRKKKRDEEDRAFAEMQEATMRATNAKLDAQALIKKRLDEDAERSRQMQLADEDTAFQALQDNERAKLTKKLDDEEYGRRVKQTWDEAGERVAATQLALSEQQAATQKQLAQELVDLRGNLDEKIDTLRANYIDKLDDILREGGQILKPLVDEITGNIARGLESIRDRAREAVTALAEAFGASEKLVGAQAAIDRANKLASDGMQSHQYGGTVSGPFGSRQLIEAHGGERFEGIGGYNTAMTAVKAAEAMLGRGIGGASTNSTTYQYNLQASYGRVQPEGSIMRDLSYLEAATRR